MKTLIILILMSVCGCATTKVYPELAPIHNANLNAAIDRSIAEQDAIDRARVIHSRSKFYYPGTSVFVVYE